MTARSAVIVLSLAALVGLSLLLDADYLWRAMTYAADHPLGLAAAFAAYTGAFALRALSWRALVPHVPAVSPVRLFNQLLAALFLNHVAPAKAGDFARMYGLSRLGVEGGRAVASVVVSRLADLIGLLVVLGAAWTLAVGDGWRMLAVPAGVAAVAALAVWGLARLPKQIRLGPLTGPLSRLRDALRETTPPSFGAALLWATPAWVLEAGILLFVARGLGLDLTLAGAVAATCFAVLVAAVPLTPGAVGTYEAGMVFALSALGVPPEPAFAAAVASHAMKFLYAFAAAPLAAYEGLGAARRHELEEVRTR